MEAEGSRANLPHLLHGVFPALSAALFISIGYIDPGKWVACIDSGARFGGDLAVFLLFFNLMAILCQYLSAHIGLVSGKNLAQICNDGYDKFNCICLGIQAELSIIMSDLAMILGIANGLHMIFRVDLFSAVLLTALNAILYPLFPTLLESSKAHAILIRIAALTFFCYVLGMLIGQPEISVSPIVVLSKLRGENVYALVSLLGANIMPHNFYLHSSIVQRFQGSMGAAKSSQAYYNFFGIFAIFSCILVVNYVLMNSAASIFYSSGLVLPTFQDAMSLMEQPLWSPIIPLGLFLLISSSHISVLSWEIGREGGQTMLYDFFGVELPGWLHCATVRIFSIMPALYCLWYSGAEGMYQMLISTQIMMAFLLPASVIALYRVASSGSLMGANKISAVVEFLMMMSFMAMVGLQLIFLGEMVFGDSDLVGYFRWNMGSTSIFSPYFILIVGCCASLCFTCRLFATPLRSADERPDAQPWKPETDMLGILPSSEKVLETHSDARAQIYGSDLPDTVMETVQEPYLTPVEEIPNIKESSTPIEGADPVEKTVRVEGKSEARKDGSEGESWEPEEASKEVLVVAPAVAPEGSRSLIGKMDEGGNGPGSLSRISGLGRTARRQLASVLDEFWGQLYDLHGQLTQEAKSKRLDLLLSADPNPKPLPILSESDSVGKEFDNIERQYSRLSLPPQSEGPSYQPATLHGYQFPSYLNRTPKDQYADYMDGQWGYPSLGLYSSRDPLAFGLSSKMANGFGSVQTSGFQNLPRNSMLQSDMSTYELFSPTLADNVANQNNPKKYHSLPDISLVPRSIGFTTSVGRTAPERSSYRNLASRVGAPPGFNEPSRRAFRGVFPSGSSSGLGNGSLWYNPPFEQFGVASKTSLSLASVDSATSIVDLEVKLLQSLRNCVLKILKFEGSEWLFRQTDTVDEDLINRVAARERFLYEAEFKDMKPGSAVKVDSMNVVSSVPHCGEGCVWKADLMVSFGVWCIHRILELSLRESRPELWGKYTYVLNHLQGVIDLAFFKQRNPISPCFCLQTPATYQHNPTDQPPPGKFTGPTTLLEIIKDVEIAISSRKGRSGTPAGDVAFPKGKENLASVLKRYKRRLSNKPIGSGNQ